jgi:hypothetical protein
MKEDKFPFRISSFKVISQPFVLFATLAIILVGIQEDKMTVAVIERIPGFIIGQGEEVKVILGISFVISQAREYRNMVDYVTKWLEE